MPSDSEADSDARKKATANSFLTREELISVGFASLGEHVRISRYARLYSPAAIFVGDDVRIDDFTLLSASHGAIRLSGWNHIGAAAMIYGPARIGHWTTISGRAAIYGVSDDFTWLEHTYPYFPHDLVVAEVGIGDDVVVGTGSTVLPGLRIADGVAIGAMSLVTRNIETEGVYAGIPVNRVADRRPR